MDILLYVRLNCRKCQELEDFLIDEHIQFETKTINTDWNSKMEFDKHGFIYVPSIAIMDESKNTIDKFHNISMYDYDKILTEIRGRQHGHN